MENRLLEKITMLHVGNNSFLQQLSGPQPTSKREMRENYKNERYFFNHTRLIIRKGICCGKVVCRKIIYLVFFYLLWNFFCVFFKDTRKRHVLISNTVRRDITGSVLNWLILTKKIISHSF